MACKPKKMANGGPTPSMAGLTTDQITQQIYANQAQRAAAAAAVPVARIPGQGRGDPGARTIAMNMHDPLGLAGNHPLTARNYFDPGNVLPGNGRSFLATGVNPLNINGDRSTTRQLLDPGGIFGGGRKKRSQEWIANRTAIEQIKGYSGMTPQQQQAAINAQRTKAGTVGPSPASAPTAGSTSGNIFGNLTQQILARRAAPQNTGVVPGYADGGKVVNRKPNGKHRGC